MSDTIRDCATIAAIILAPILAMAILLIGMVARHDALWRVVP